ncbi:ROK family transcriptional regulator [Rubrobacter aplysinae]|uniref:ROK family transcriptional regulator n=1 Tax=Rubrobacter aplysinae TaxID=909625 RepID=UPI00064BF78A|nr:ROK family transcriptional regulator [Rubrobacter aplysinae]
MGNGTNLLGVRDYNEQVVLELIRVNGGISRVEIAKRVGLTAQTVSNIVRRTLEKGLVVESEKVSPVSVGKPRVGLQINPQAGYALGVQIDCDEITLVVLDLAGGVVYTTERETPEEHGPDAVVSEVAELVEDSLIGSELERGKVLGLGVCCPGPLDHDTGVVYNPPNLRGWTEVPLKDSLEQKVGLPVLVDNDATASAVGERWSGGAQGARDFAFIYVGVGIGAGLFLDNRLLRGSSSNAGEFGHTTLNIEGPECFCGRRGCVEMYCAPAAVARRVQQRLDAGVQSIMTQWERGELLFEDVSAAAVEGDALARDELVRSSRMLGQGVVDLVNTLDLELVVLGGKGLGEAAGIYVQEIEEILRQTTLARNLQHTRVELSHGGTYSGSVGGAASVLHTTYHPQLRGVETV